MERYRRDEEVKLQNEVTELKTTYFAAKSKKQIDNAFFNSHGFAKWLNEER